LFNEEGEVAAHETEVRKAALFVDIATLFDLDQVSFEAVEQLTGCETLAPIVDPAGDDVALLIEHRVLLGAVG
jgi:hypothetical protein